MAVKSARKTAASPRKKTTVSQPVDALSLGRFSQVVESIYAAAVDHTLWTTALEEIRRALAASYVSLIVQPSTGDDNGLIVSVASDRGPLSVTNPPLVESPFAGIALNHLVTSDDLLSDAHWRESDYYRKWCAPFDVYHVMAADLSTREGNVYGFRVTRPESAAAFSQADRTIGRHLLPHLKRALDIHQSASRDREIGHVYGRAMAGLMVGVIVLDESGVLIENNSAAGSILDLNDGLQIADGKLKAAFGNDDRALNRLLRSALAGSGAAQAMSIGRPSGHFNWGVVVQAIPPDPWSKGKRRPSVAVFVRDCEGLAEPPVRFAQQLFRLTPAETSLATKLINGLSLEEAANALNIRRNTARAHLRSIFSKTGVRRQAELVRLFLNSVAWFGGTKKPSESTSEDDQSS